MQYSKHCPNMKLQQIIFHFSLIIVNISDNNWIYYFNTVLILVLYKCEQLI